MTVNRLAVIAIGGNSLIKDKEKIAMHYQLENVKETCANIAELVAKGWNVIITHGNGPQVGFLVRRAELAAPHLPLIPLDIVGADTQGAIGYMIAQSLANEFRKRGIKREAVALVTQTVVDKDDPAFANPTKPIGGFMTREQAMKHAEEDGWTVVEDAGRGWRRVVPSPEPRRIVELGAIKELVQRGFVVVCAGGGGIPVVEEDGNLVGVAAVIDKDLGTSLLASSLGADALIISTGVRKVALNYGRPDQVDLDRLTLAEAKRYLAEGHFPPGNMGPKIVALIRYLESGGKLGIVTCPEELAAAAEGKAGTMFVH